MSEPTPIRQHRRYSRRQKVTAVIAAEMSSLTEAAASNDVPITTLDYWMDLPEFVELRKKTREDMAEESKALAHKTLAVIKAKIDQFEPRDLTILYGVLVDKGQLLTGQATSRAETRQLTEGLDDHEKEALRTIIADAIKEAEIAGG